MSEAAPGCQLHAVLRCVLEARLLCGSDLRRLPGGLGRSEDNKGKWPCICWRRKGSRGRRGGETKAGDNERHVN